MGVLQRWLHKDISGENCSLVIHYIRLTTTTKIVQGFSLTNNCEQKQLNQIYFVDIRESPT